MAGWAITRPYSQGMSYRTTSATANIMCRLKQAGSSPTSNQPTVTANLQTNPNQAIKQTANYLCQCNTGCSSHCMLRQSRESIIRAIQRDCLDIVIFGGDQNTSYQSTRQECGLSSAGRHAGRSWGGEQCFIRINCCGEREESLGEVSRSRQNILLASYLSVRLRTERRLLKH